jgi:hypothetical protein
MHSTPSRPPPAPGPLRAPPLRSMRANLQEDRPPEGPHEEDSQHIGLQQAEEPRADRGRGRGIDGPPATRSSPTLPSPFR